MERSNNLIENNYYLYIQMYHSQLWSEITTLFQLVKGLCKDHSFHTENSLSRAILFTFFGAIETSLRVISSAALLVNKFYIDDKTIILEDGSRPIKRLTHAEVLFLKQEAESIDTKKWETKLSSKFVSFEETLIGYPTIYGKLFGFLVSIDKSTSEWQKLIELKKLRDLGAHGNILQYRAEVEVVTYKDIRELLLSRKWYCQQLVNLPWVAGIEMEGELRAINSLEEHLLNK